MVWWLFQNLVITAALAALVAGVCRTTRIGPVARHALWVLVLVKFITPPFVVWPWAVPDPLGLATIDVRIDVQSAAARDVRIASTTAPGTRDLVVLQQAKSAPALDNGAARSTSFGGSSVFSWFLWVWAAGSICVFAVEATRLARLARRVTAAAPADPAIVTRVAELSARLGLRPVPVVTLAGGGSPMIWCLGRPRLLWPADLSAGSSGDQPSELTGTRIDGVIVHELAHVTRKDHLIGWLELVAGIVWWWNPLFWFVRSSLREQAELACDAWVISALPDGRRAYAEALLTLCGATGFGTASRSMAVIGIRPGSRRALERRLVMIMKGRTALRLPMAGLIALGLMAAATLPAWATVQQQTPPVPLPPPAPASKPRPVPDAPPLPPPPPPPAVEVQVEPVKPDSPPAPAQPARRPTTRQAVPAIAWLTVDQSNLPADGRQLVEGFDNESKAIRAEADRKIEARREAVTKALQDLQEQYTKAGKLDEAVAIRDYLRSGGPRLDGAEFWVRPAIRR